jgi:hypothetical protein
MDKDILAALHDKIEAAQDAKNITYPATLTVVDAGGRIVYTLRRNNLQEGFGIDGDKIRGRLPLTATLTDATGKTIQL